MESKLKSQAMDSVGELPAGYLHLPTTPIKQEPKLTDWFDGAKFVPAHVGVYEAACGYYRFWNGVKWGGHGATVDRALLFVDLFDFDQSPTWRGIKK